MVDLELTLACGPYGIDANRPTLTALIRHRAEQGMITREIPIDELLVSLDT